MYELPDGMEMSRVEWKTMENCISDAMNQMHSNAHRSRNRKEHESLGRSQPKDPNDLDSEELKQLSLSYVYQTDFLTMCS